jgi:hypothetical protein
MSGAGNGVGKARANVMSAKASLSFDIYLRAAPQQVRAVLTDPALAPRWLVGIQFQPGREEDPQRLTCEWLQSDHLEANGGAASVVRFEFVAMGEVTRLTVTHQDLVPGGSFLNVVASGWPMILSGLKSLIETGRPLEFSCPGFHLGGGGVVAGGGGMPAGWSGLPHSR